MTQPALQPVVSSIAQPDPQLAPSAVPSDVMFRTLFVFLMPFFAMGSPTDPGLAQDAIVGLIESYNAATMKELDLAGRIIAFSMASMESLRLAMRPELSDSKVLQYRANAVNLSKCADRCQAMLDAMQANRAPAVQQPTANPRQPAAEPAQPVAAETAWAGAPGATKPADAARPAAAVDPASAAKPEAATASVDPAKPAAQAAAPQATSRRVPALGQDLEQAQRNARLMIEALRASDKPLSELLQPRPNGQDPLDALIEAAARGAQDEAGRKSAKRG